MLLTIERVAILRKIDIFAETPNSSLAAVARILEEVELAAGEQFITEGETGNCLYIIIEGEVIVQSKDQTIMKLGAGKTVGELALLDPEPRSASVRAVGETLLFRIDSEPFEEVLADRPEVAQGIIRALVRRLRRQGEIITVAQRAQHLTNKVDYP